MSASPHSLQNSSTAQPSASPNPKRSSLGSHQLPLPSSLNASVSQRPPVGVTVSSAARPSSPTTHNRNLSASSAPRSSTELQPISPTKAAFSPHRSTTHAGGIQPSASFFRPSRPIYQPQYSRPNSVGSLSGLPVPLEHDAFPLSPLSNNHANSSDEQLESVNEHAASIIDDQKQFSTLKRIKQSREPLLPIGARPGGLGLSHQRNSSHSHNQPPTSPTKNATRLVRNSFDRVINLSRGLSFDSIRKSTGSRTPGHSEGRPTFDSKISDEEHGDGYGDISPTSPTKYRRSMSPIDFDGHPITANRRHVRSTMNSATSPDHAFNPIPPDRTPPLSKVPRIDPKTGKPIRRYQLHPSRNRFFFGGRVMTGGDAPWAFMASFSLVVCIAGVWFATTSVYWWHHISPAVSIIGGYIALLVISSMFATAFCDPGILPRDLDPDPPYPSVSPSESQIRAPMPRDLKVRTDVVRVKYCQTCRTYRPPRSSHCKMCDNCVDGCDHHCQWVNNCIGRRNYTTFFVLLLSATTMIILVIVTSALHLFFLTQREHLDFKHALRKGAGSAVGFCLAIAVIFPVSALLSYHVRLLLLNITTIEQIRNQAHKSLIPGPPPPNPFSHGSWKRNLVAVLCRPRGASWLNATAIATEDKREINPGLANVAVWDGTVRTGQEQGIAR